jgi:hypothetical protein
MALSEIVNVQIQAGTVNPARKGFGVPLLMAFHNAWAGSEVRTYRTFSEVAADFAAHEWPRLAAAAMFAQKIRPSTIKIGKLPIPTGVPQIVVLDFANHPTGSAITGTVTSSAGVETAINVAWNTNIATTLAAVDTAIEAAIGAASVATASPVLTITVPLAGNGVAHFEFPTAYARETTANQAYDAALDAALVLDPEFYFVLTDTASPKNIDKIARWASANGRFYLAGPMYGDPSDFVSGEFSAGADYTALLANDACAGLFSESARNAAIEAAWCGCMAPRDPGSATWAFKTLEGVGADDWTSTQRNTIATTNRGNHYTTEAAIGITRPGKTFGGEWIDVVLGIAWIEARAQEAIFSLLANEPKVPYTEAGVGQIEAVLRGVLREAERRSIIDAGWTITHLPVADQATADRASRILRGLEFSARLAGAIHQVNLVGTVTV